MRVPYNYLDQQFADVEEHIRDLRQLVATGEFTLGPFVEAFEKKFAAYVGAKHAIGTNTGTGALILSLKAVGVRPGHEVITVANTFIATAGAIVATGARPVFVDCDDRYQIDVSRIEAAITAKTAAILPVHWAGCPPEMEKILEIARRRGIPVVEDACQAVGAKINGRWAGTFGQAGAFSMHPVKPLNVWGDGGVIVTNDDAIAKFLRLYRNHGMADRDHIEIWGVNDRLQPVQAVVGSRVLDTVDGLIQRRIDHAKLLDDGLKGLEANIYVPRRLPGYREVYQLYLVLAKRRDEFVKFLISRGIEAKIHYPIPIHLQKAARELGYQRGAFPVCERQADEIVTLPAHQYINAEQIAYMLSVIREFYAG